MKEEVSRLRVGVDYYPEHWEESLWEPDILLMKKSGVRIVRVAEFAWSRMEPREGQFDFGWLDRALDLFHRHGLKAVLGTPTATPPRWLTRACPDVLPVFAGGEVFHPGVRGHRCYNSPSLARYGGRIIERMAERYTNHPAVVGWQTDNEFGMMDCHCAACTDAFRSWLRGKYGTVETLNREWGTVVWSGEYSEWDEVTTPLGGSPHQNPSLLLDYERFQWDSAAAFQERQIAILRRICPVHVVTHNFHSYPQRLDLHLLGEPLDVASFDYYPNTSPRKQATAPYSGALSLDLTRGIKRKNFWIMEQLSGAPGCWMPMWRTPYPGFIRAYAWQAIARGADTVVHFRWRSATAGAEQFWHGLIDHSNMPGRRLAEFTRFCGEVNALADKLEGTVLRNEAAILYSAEQLAALRIQPQAAGMDYYEHIKLYHRALTKQGIGCDVVDLRAPLDGYKLVIAPSLYLLDESVAKSLTDYASGGGRLVLTHRTGVKHRNNQCVMLPLPGLLAECAGVTVDEYDPLGEETIRIRNKEGEQYSCGQWCDLLRPVTARPVAWYAEDYYAGTPAVTVNEYGRGKVYYIGTHAEERYWADLIGEIAGEAGVNRIAGLPEGVQVTVRSGPSGRFLFVLNLNRSAAEVPLPGEGTSLLDGSRKSGKLQLEPYGVEILEL